jgi:neutral ceramidase
MKSRIIYCFFLIIFLNSCAVVKTPYFKTAYYQKTLSRLDSIKSGLICINDSVFAGFSRVSITPQIKDNKEPVKKSDKVPLAGFGQLKGKYATGIHDSIFVKAVALKTGDQTIVVISADLLIMPPNIIDSVASILLRKGLQRNQLFFSATHSHSSLGGWGYGLIAKTFSGKENPDIIKWLITRINRAITDAISDLHPAKLGSGSFNAAQYTRNRLTGNPLQKNNDFNFLVLEQTGGRKAIIGSFSAHATTIGRKNTEISADYPGYWERKMENSTFDMAMFCGGSMGSQSAVSQGNEFDNSKYIGEALADSLLYNVKKIKLNEKVTLSALSLKIFLPEYHIRMSTNRNFTSGFSNMLMPLPKNVYLQALRINDLIWFFTPGDFSGESATQIKRLLAGEGYKAMITGYNGSYVGYLIPGKYFYLNHYESKLMGWFGPTMGDYTMDLIDLMGNALIINK